MWPGAAGIGRACDRQALWHLSKHWREGAKRKGMTLTKRTKSLSKPKGSAANSPERNKLLAQCAVLPEMRHAQITADYGKMLGEMGDWHDRVDAISVTAKAMRSGNSSLLNRTLCAQALSLDAIFTDLAHSAALNRGQYPDAFERYMRLALKAQSASRATMETLARLHQPREQTVKHVHVNEGGQAVVADHFHQHRGDGENGKQKEQSDAARTAGTIAALPSPDPLGNGVPIPGSEREAALQDARGDESRRT